MERTTIPLFGDRVAIVDAADYERVAAHRWYAKADGAVVRAVRNVPGQQPHWWSTQRLECFILGTTALVRFRDGNPLHCWRDNMEAL